MIINAKYASSCNVCGRHIGVGEKIEWSRGARAVHAACATSGSTASRSTAARGGYDRKGCVTGGNCSSFGDGHSCGGHDCDGW